MEITNQKNDNFVISIHSVQPKNNLERMLESTFRIIDNCIIDVANVPELQQVHDKVVEKYKAGNGKCTSRYKFSRPYQSTIYIEIGEFMTINLRKLRGTVE